MRLSLLPLATAALLGACATAPQVAAPQNAADLAMFAAVHVTPEAVQPDSKRIAAAVGFKPTPSFTMVLERQQKDEKAQERLIRFNIAVSDVGNGMVREVSEQTSNGFPWGRRAQLTAHGWVELKGEFINSGDKQVRFSQPNAYAPLTAMQSGFADPKVGETFMLETAKTDRWKGKRMTCKVDAAREARTVAPSLGGMAYDVKCESAFDGVVSTRVEYLYLAALNYAVVLKVTTPSFTDTNKLVDIKMS